jgi:flagellar hook assembly protein FlgD
MECEVLAVDGGQIAVNIYDLGGRRVRRLFNIKGQSGVYSSENLTQLRWDGTDDQGENVAPGLYLIQLNIEGDARASASTRTVGVAY